VGAVVPLGKEAISNRSNWVKSATAFTLGGLTASSLVASLLSGLSALLLDKVRSDQIGPIVVLGISLLGVLREVLLPEVPLLQPRRQTRSVWAKHLTPIVTSACWGFDIGLMVTTWFTYAGSWAVVALVLLAPSVGWSVIVLAVYWLGRALPVWLSPMLLGKTDSSAEIHACVRAGLSRTRLVHVGGLLLLVAAIAHGLSYGGGIW
jgi:cytochrome c biogenesis protein CcdA